MFIPVVYNALDKMKTMVKFFINSPKQEGLLVEVAKKEGHTFRQRKVPPIDVCQTRWAACHNAYSHFYTACVFIRLHKAIYSTDVTFRWEGKYKAEAIVGS